MSQLTAKKLEVLFAEYGWSLSEVAPNRWQSGFAGERQVYPLYINLSSTCLSFEVRPIVDDFRVDYTGALLAHELLELNSRLQVVKVAIRENGEICLSCQILTMGVDLQILARVLEIIGYYADVVSQDLLDRLPKVPKRSSLAYLS